MRKSIHVVVPVNPNNVDLDFIKLYPTIFNNSSLHFSIVGKDPSQIAKQLPIGINSLISCDATGYNYSFAFNVVLKSLEKEFDSNDLVVVTDSWCAFSLIQIFRYELKITNVDQDFNLENAFIVVDIYHDKYRINTESKKIGYTIMKRAQAVKGRYDPYCPVVITTINNLINLENGLEENLFSEFSRIHLINQLKKIGLSEIHSVNPGLTLRKKDLIDPTVERDLKYINEYFEESKDQLFIPSNYNTNWGEIVKVVKMAENPYGELVWDLASKSALDYLTLENKKTKQDEIQNKIEKTTIEPEDIKLEGKKIILLIQTGTKYFICSTPLVKKLYEKFGPIDILTNSRNDSSTELIKGPMINTIYDLEDLSTKKFLHKYDSVIKTQGCTFSIPKLQEQQIYEPFREKQFLTETNYSIIDRGMISRIPDPYCNYDKSIKDSLEDFPDLICIQASQNIKYKKESIWKMYENLISKLANHFSLFIIGLKDEDFILHRDRFEGRSKRVKILNNIEQARAASIIRSSNLFIGSSWSDLSWISYGIKARTILLTKGDEQIPDCNWIDKIFADDKLKFDYMVSLIWERI